MIDPSEWKGDNPFCLLIVGEGEAVTVIDLDEPGWVAAHSELMRAPGRWILARKFGSLPVLVLAVAEGEQPYYTSRVFHPFGPVERCPECGDSMDWQSVEYRAYSIGKKRLDKHVDRLWVLPNGTICGGDDVDQFGHEFIKTSMNERWKTHYALHNGKQEQEEGSHQERTGAAHG